MGEFSLSHILIVGAVILIFGPKRLPGLGKSLGEAIRGFKGAMDGDDANPAEKNRVASSPEQIRSNPAPTPVATEIKEKESV